MNKSQLNLSSILGILVAVVFFWVFLFSIWYSNNILNQDKFVATTVSVLQTENVRNAISNEIIDTVKQRRPIIGAISAPLLAKIIAGVMDSDVFVNVDTKIAQQLQLQLTTANPREITIELKPTKDFLSPFIERANPELLDRIPDEIPVIKRNQIPSLYKFGTAITVLGPILLIVGLILLGLIWRKVSDKRNYITVLSLCFASTALLIYFIIPAMGNYLIAQSDSVNISTIINEVYMAFTVPISQFAFNLMIAGIIIALIARFVRREIFRIPNRETTSKVK